MAKKIYNGRITIRTTPTLHKELVKEADGENVSLNLYINNLLASNTKKGKKKRASTSPRS